jgi:hypothetical protein
LLERLEVPGGLIRSEHLNGVLYEPHGSHIFHTEDRDVWELANAMTPFNDYRHRVDINVEGRIHNWPILLSDIEAQSRSEEIAPSWPSARRRRRRPRAGRQLRGVVPGADGADPLRALHPALHGEAVGPPARELSASGRRGGSRALGQRPVPLSRPLPGLARGPGGYTDLIDGLLDSDLIEVRTGVDVTLESLDAHVRDAAPTWSS